GGEIGAHHIERAMREIDEVHDPKHQRQPRRQQEQQQPELQSIQDLFDNEQHRSPRQQAKAAAFVTLPLLFYFALPSLVSKIRAHFIGHLSWKRSWSSLTMVATVFSDSSPPAPLTTSCR